MFPATKAKVMAFMAGALVLGLVSMELATNELGLSGGATGYVVGSVDPVNGSGFILLLAGVVVGAIIVGSFVYVLHIEQKR